MDYLAFSIGQAVLWYITWRRINGRTHSLSGEREPLLNEPQISIMLFYDPWIFFLAFVSAGKRFIAIFIYICIPRDITIIAV